MSKVNVLVLATRSEVTDLHSSINGLLNFNLSDKIIMPIIFDLCANEKSAELDITTECLSMMTSGLGEMCGDNVEDLADAMITFGILIHKKLQYMNMYKNGVLSFKYAYMLGNDAVMIPH